ncbi:MAG: hypothetical protein M0Z55_01675, partial [Peptococcaceae bacterium]|nr:hypothetical protein [Peptococcaceae bacterium]
MKRIVVVYHSYRGLTGQLVEAFQKGVETNGGKCELLQATDASPENLLDADIIVLASGQPFNTLSGQVKAFVERCWKYEGKANFAGKGYTTIINGSKDPLAVVNYLDSIMPFFKLEKVADGLACLANDVEESIKLAEEFGA